MGMPGNMNNLMKQAQKMQRQMEENQKALEEKDERLRQQYYRDGSGRVCALCRCSDEFYDAASLHCSVCGRMIAPNRRYFVSASLQTVVCCSCFASQPHLFLRENKPSCEPVTPTSPLSPSGSRACAVVGGSTRCASSTTTASR